MYKIILITPISTTYIIAKIINYYCEHCDAIITGFYIKNICMMLIIIKSVKIIIMSWVYVVNKKVNAIYKQKETLLFVFSFFHFMAKRFKIAAIWNKVSKLNVTSFLIENRPDLVLFISFELFEFETYSSFISNLTFFGCLNWLLFFFNSTSYGFCQWILEVSTSTLLH